ncbi:MAG: hypothetical protein HQ461_13495 [Deltaproteobacteria bacterium]|nr:hypothetical protein [Deltaproteobacteria bacterium]
MKNHIASLALIALMLSASMAHALSPEEVASRMEAASGLLAELETHELRDDASQDISTARLAITDIQTSLASEMYGKAETTLLTLEATLKLVKSLLDRGEIDQLADKREADNVTIQTQADELQLELETTSSRRTDLQSQVSAIVDSLDKDTPAPNSGK